MLKINTSKRRPFDPTDDCGYALDNDGELWLFPESEDIGIFFGEEGAEYNPKAFSDTSVIGDSYGPFTWFDGTATVGN